MGLNVPNISKVINGGLSQTGGYIFKFEIEEPPIKEVKSWDNIKDDIYETKRNVFKLVSAELPTKEIAKKLGISEASVRVYKAEVFEKMRIEITRLNNELG